MRIIYFFLAHRATTHLRDVAVGGLPAHVGVERAVGVGALPTNSWRTHTLKLKEEKIFLDKNIKPCLLFQFIGKRLTGRTLWTEGGGAVGRVRGRRSGVR
jgi:hypothetical protein